MIRPRKASTGISEALLSDDHPFRALPAWTHRAQLLQDLHRMSSNITNLGTNCWIIHARKANSGKYDMMTVEVATH